MTNLPDGFNQEAAALIKRCRVYESNSLIADLGYYASSGMINTDYYRIAFALYHEGWSGAKPEAVLREAILRRFDPERKGQPDPVLDMLKVKR